MTGALTDPLESGDRSIDAAYARLVQAAQVKGKTRVVKVEASDVKSILFQFRMLVRKATS